MSSSVNYWFLFIFQNGKRNFLNAQKIFSDATYDTAIAPVKYPSKCHYAT